MRARAGRRTRSAALLALGTWLAARGGMAVAGIVLAVLGAMASVVVALVLAAEGRSAASLPAIASSAIAWGAGVTLAFGAAMRALERDREQGVLALARARGASLGQYVRGRVGGLVVVLALATGGATLVAGLAAVSVSAAPLAVGRASLAALAYALVFSLTMGPVAMASLGTGTRLGGYLTLLAVLVVPEIVSPWTSALLPRGWHELTSIPAALSAVRAGIALHVVPLAHLVRALAALAAVVALSLLVVVARVRRAEPGEHAV